MNLAELFSSALLSLNPAFFTSLAACSAAESSRVLLGGKAAALRPVIILSLAACKMASAVRHWHWQCCCAGLLGAGGVTAHSPHQPRETVPSTPCPPHLCFLELPLLLSLLLSLQHGTSDAWGGALALVGETLGACACNGTAVLCCAVLCPCLGPLLLRLLFSLRQERNTSTALLEQPTWRQSSGTPAKQGRCRKSSLALRSDTRPSSLQLPACSNAPSAAPAPPPLPPSPPPLPPVQPPWQPPWRQPLPPSPPPWLPAQPPWRPLSRPAGK